MHPAWTCRRSLRESAHGDKLTACQNFGTQSRQVTGTLEALLKEDRIKNILKKEYRIEHLTFMPSVFGDRDLRVPWKGANMLTIAGGEGDWLTNIEGNVREERKSGNSVLVFFEDEHFLQKYLQRQSNRDLDHLTKRTGAEDRRAIIAAATGSGKVTLFTRDFGRGIDFTMPDGHCVVVILTFLPSIVSEQTQIGGRTGRQGMGGKFLRLLCAEHLVANFDITDQEIEMLKMAHDPNSILELKQQQKMQSTAKAMEERKEKAATAEKQTRVWEQKLFNPRVAVEDKLAVLCELNQSFSRVHYTLLLDCSHSMSKDGRWCALTQAVARFKAQLQGNPQAARSTQVSIITFNSQATAVQKHAQVQEMMDISTWLCSGRTNFAAAFSECKEVIRASQPGTVELILFLTDGEHLPCYGDPCVAAADLVTEFGHSINSLICVGFGTEVESEHLARLCRVFSDRGKDAVVKRPQDPATLLKAFVEAADTAAVHVSSLR